MRLEIGSAILCASRFSDAIWCRFWLKFNYSFTGHPKYSYSLQNKWQDTNPPCFSNQFTELNLFVSSTIPSQGCGSFKGNIYLGKKSFRIAICMIHYFINIAHFCTCEIEEGIVVGKHSSYGSVHRIAVSSEEPSCCLCCMAFCIIAPINPWNLHWKCSVATMNQTLPLSSYTSDSVQVWIFDSMY